MSPTIEDLRSALAGAATTTPQPGRLVAVRTAIARRRRVRAAGGAVALLAVAAGVFGLAGSLPSERAEPPATGPTTGMATYRAGGRLIGAASLSGAIGQSRTFTIVPTGWGLAVADECTAPPDRGVYLAITVNGHPYSSGSCGSSTRGTFEEDEKMWRPLGVRMGSPTTITVRVMARAELDPHPGMALDGGSAARASVGVYQDVPLDQYPMPVRPATVRRPAGLGGPGIHGPFSVKARVTMPQPTGTWTRTLPYSQTLTLDAVTWAPGQLRFLVGGKVVDGLTSWTYDQNGGGLDLSPTNLQDAGVPVPREGEPITITVQAERFTDPAWQATIGVHTP